MKLFSILILFGIVNISTSEMRYMKEIVIAKELIQQAFDMNNRFIGEKFIANGLEHVIKTFVFNDEYLLSYINHMFILPEFLYLDDVSASLETHQTLNKIIMDELKIAASFPPFQGFMELDFVELAQERRRLTRIALRNIINQAIDDESKDLVTPSLYDDFGSLSVNATTEQNSLDISVASSEDKSEVDSDDGGDISMIDFDEGQDNEKSVLLSNIVEDSEGQDDEKPTSPSSMIEHHDGQDDDKSVPPSIEQPEINETYIGKDEGEPSNRNRYEVPIRVMCNCIALFLNTKFPTSYLYVFTINSEQICTIKKKKNIGSVFETFSFRKINGIWSEELKMILDQE